MAHLWHDIKSHRLAAAIFLVVWLAAWGITVGIWQYDADGYSFGMHPVSIPWHFVLPLVVGGLVGWWRAAFGAGIKGGMLAGMLFCVTNMAILVAWSGILIALGRVSPDANLAWWEGLFEVLHLGLTYALIGLALGAVGGLGGAALSVVMRRRLAE
jgi:hypothetical protein